MSTSDAMTTVSIIPGFIQYFLQQFRIGQNVFRQLQIEEGSMCEMFATILDQFELGAFHETARMEGMFVRHIFADTI